MAKLATVSQWQRERAAEMHAEFLNVERRMTNERLTLTKAIAEAQQSLELKRVRKGNGSKAIKASFSTVLQAYYRWKKNGKKAEALILDYKPGREKIPSRLIEELHRLGTGEGKQHISVTVKQLRDAWKAGRPIPGLGTWQEWWVNNHPDHDLPPVAPEFPFSDRTLYRHQPDKRSRALGNKGFAAFKGAAPFVSLDYSKLRKCELYTLDDVRLDIICIDEATGQSIEVICYVMMEVASRSIVAYLLKPAAHIKQEDVDELIAYGLTKWGIGDGYTTHVKLERGTVAMSEAAKMVLEAATNGGIQIHRTSMNTGIRWIGSAKDKASGHAAGKAVIESFNRKLHLMLGDLPGQRGNEWKNQPANLGYEGADKITPRSVLAEAEKLAKFQIASGQRIRLQLAVLYLKEVRQMVRAAIERHNHEPGHDYQGHGSFTEREIAPGVWTR